MFINDFNPVAFNILSLEIRWYSLSYIFGIFFGWFYCKQKLISNDIYKRLFDDYITYLIFGIIIGGRIGYVVIYNFDYYFNNPLEIPMIWKGGMSFHGAVIGIIIATYLFSNKSNISSNNNVFHKKYGNGVIINAESDTAEVKFQKFGIKKVYIKYLIPKT